MKAEQIACTNVQGDIEAKRLPLVVHVVYRFDTGGLENGVVNLINHMSAGKYDHLVLALTEVTDFRRRLERDDVECLALRKPPGHGFWLYRRVWQLLRERRPAIVHTRNLAALEMQVPAWAAGVPVRIHGEHGRDTDDLDGSSRKHQQLRRLYSPFVHGYVALSRELEQYLSGPVGIEDSRIERICNGVDALHFAPAGSGRGAADVPFDNRELCVFGTVGRMHGVKNQTLLARAFLRALALDPGLRDTIRLVMVGDGPLRAECRAVLDAEDAAPLSWLPGERSDVADVMRALSCFVQPSQAEGISNTILEAMATGLPVIATNVGGNCELVDGGRTGVLVPASDVEAMAEAMVQMARNRKRSLEMGRAARVDVETRFSVQAMVGAYERLYDRHLTVSGYARGGH